MKMPNGYGCVTKLSGNRRKPYIAKVTIGWTNDGKQKIKILGYYISRQEGLNALSSYNMHPEDHEYTRMTVNDCYLAMVNHRWKGNIPSIYYSAYMCCKSIHNKEIAKLKTIDYQNAIDTAKAGNAYKRSIKAVFKQILDYALSNDIVSRNYAELVVLEKPKKSTMHKPFTDKELESLRNVDDDIARALLIMCYTGMRPIELLTIERKNVHIKESYMIGGSKTEAGKNRVIPISDKIMPYVKRFYNRKTTYLYSEKPTTYSMFTFAFEKFRKKYKSIIHNHLLHDGRHTCMTLMNKANVDRMLCKRILGHTIDDVTENVYTHRNVEELVTAINRI